MVRSAAAVRAAFDAGISFCSLSAAATPLLQDGRLWRLQFDTDEREVDRDSGPEGVVLAEWLFR
jgi:hypothetical protein